MLTAEELLARAAQAAPAPPAPPPPMPYPPHPVYYVPQKKSTNWFAVFLLAVVIIGALFGASGLISVSDLSKAPAMAMATPANGAVITHPTEFPTAYIVLRNSSGTVVTPVSQAPPQAPPAVATAVPVQATAMPVRVETTAFPVVSEPVVSAPAVSAPVIENPAPVSPASNDSAWSGPPSTVNQAPSTTEWSGGGNGGGGGGGSTHAAQPASIPVPNDGGGGGGSSGFN